MALVAPTENSAVRSDAVPTGITRQQTKEQGRTMATRSTLQRGAVLAAAAALAAGLCAPAQAKITLTFANWAAAEAATRPGIEEMIRKFEAANPDIEIKSEAVSFSEIARQLVLRIRSGNPPDVAEIAGNDLFLVAASGKLEPLDSYLGADGLKQFKPDSIRVLREGGKLIALPWTDSPAGFWYNKEIMQKAGLDPSKPPRTIDELIAAMKAIKSSQPDVIPLGLDTTNRAFSMISNWPWLQTFGATPFGPAGASATSPAMKQYLTWMRELAKNGYIDPGRKIGEFRPLAAQNKVAFHWDQVLLQGVIQSVNKDRKSVV
jgi:multiple sugar transport system substrate-binding protein